MACKIEIPKNIWDIIDFHAYAYGNLERDGFSQFIFCEIQEKEIESPIEQALFSALKYIQKANLIPEASPELNSRGEPYLFGLRITPQHRIDKYRVDFFIEWFTKEAYNSVVVECDSQEFHDRTERERRYEKARDRFLQIKNYKVFRYTGAEILKNSIQIAVEILSFATQWHLIDGVIE